MNSPTEKVNTAIKPVDNACSIERFPAREIDLRTAASTEPERAGTENSRSQSLTLNSFSSANHDRPHMTSPRPLLRTASQATDNSFQSVSTQRSAKPLEDIARMAKPIAQAKPHATAVIPATQAKPDKPTDTHADATSADQTFRQPPHSERSWNEH